VTIRVRDRLGNEGESAPFVIRQPTAEQVADARVAAPPSPGARAGRAAAAAVAGVFRAARRFHARRGLPLAAGLRVARTGAEWRRVLGVADARAYSGFAAFDGTVFLGPAATRALELLGAAGGGGLSRADVDRIAMGLAVLLHETLHATGPQAADDVAGTRSGRAFEEGFTEAVTLDLLPSFAASLELPAGMERRVRAAVRRYRPAYGAQVAWARRLSARATGAAPGSARARAWRRAVADGWGAGRWARLAEATRLDEDALRPMAAAGWRA
jgi:hypothetical protein